MFVSLCHLIYGLLTFKMQNGGAMPETNNFFADSIRHGFILNDVRMSDAQSKNLVIHVDQLTSLCFNVPRVKKIETKVKWCARKKYG